MKVSKFLSVGSCIVFFVLLSGCQLDGRDNRVSEDFHYSYELQPGAHLDLTNTNGSVEVSGWDRNSIDVSGTKYAPDQSGLEHIHVRVDAHGDRARITTELPRSDWFGGNFGVNYRIHVPTRILLDRLETTNGHIAAENLEGGGKVNSTNGKLSLTHLTGNYRVETTNGSIDWEECNGDEKAATTNGSVRGHIRSGSIEARSTNGSVDLTVEQPSDRKPMRVSTTNGSVTLALANFSGNPVTAETTHGTVSLRLPENTNARLSAATTMASISMELRLSSTEENSKHSLRGQLGSGGPEIEATSNMGSIRIQRY